jgi:ribosome-binding factor A
MASDVKRGVRVAERVREELSRLLARKVRDPRAEGVIVSRVEMTDDLGLARVYFRLLEPSEAKIQDAKKGLEKAKGLLRAELTKTVKLRTAPDLRFFYDEGVDAQTRIEQLFEEVKRERGGDS